MKLKTIALAALSAAGALASCGAWAQSNVTIYGRVDVGVQRIDNGTTQTRVDSGTYTASRLGFRGTEDLGGGLSALFFMETGFNADTGVAQGGNRFWNRGAYVGLSSKDWGTVTLGRQYVPIFWPFLFADDAGPLRLHGYSAVQSVQRSNFFRVNSSALRLPAGNGTLGAAAGGIYSVGISSAFENNLMIYKTPSFGGFTATVAAGAGENNADGGKVFGANAEYRNGPLYLGGGWTSKEGVVTGTSTQQKVREQMLGGMYSITSKFNVWGNVHTWDFATGGSRFNGRDAMIGVSYLLPTGQLWANYGRKKVDDCTDCGSSGLGVSYHHFLSKRSELYLSYGSVSNSANAANTLNGFAPVTAGHSVRGIAAGIAHQF